MQRNLWRQDNGQAACVTFVTRRCETWKLLSDPMSRANQFDWPKPLSIDVEVEECKR